MSVILILIPVSVVVAAAFFCGFIWAVQSGQYEDTCTPSMRMLADEPEPKPAVEIETDRESLLKPE